MMEPPYLSCIVTAYNQDRIIARALNSLLSQSIDRSSYEIVVVDDCSQDNTAVEISRFIRDKLPRVGTVRLTRNVGRAGVRNEGVRATTGGLIVFVDGDILVEENYLEAHLRRHREARGADVVVIGNVRYPDEVISESNFKRFVNSRYLGQRSMRERQRMTANGLHPFHFASGIASVPRRLFELVGGFDEMFFGYGSEDVEFGVRITNAGAKIIFANDARALHFDDCSIERVKAKMIENGKYNLPRVAARFPEYFDSGSRRLLLHAMNRRRSISAKLIGLMVSAPVARLIESAVRFSDRKRICYAPIVYQALTLGWIYRGMREGIASEGGR